MIIANVFLFLIMAYKYFPQTEEDIKEMLDVSGVKSLSDLYGEIPEELKLNREYNIQKLTLESILKNLGEKTSS